jgi:ubiquinol-cytochrome c reductase cytochrome b subunit
MLAHLVFLHSTGRTSTLLCLGDYDKIKFFPYYVAKDGLNLLIWASFFAFALSFPFVLGDAEMFIAANRLRRPVHIVPEWYFLFAYAILRSIPNKIMGVVAFAMSLITLYFFALITNYTTPLNLLNKFLVFWFIGVGVMLT